MVIFPASAIDGRLRLNVGMPRMESGLHAERLTSQDRTRKGLTMRTALLHMTTAVLLCLPMAMVSAQSAKPATAGQPDKTQSTTIVGCLVQGNPTAASAERKPEVAIANANDYYVRTPTVAIPVGGTVAVGKPGTTSTATSAGTPVGDSFYRITGMGADQLKPHLGHRVEFQGHLTANEKGDATTGVTSARTTVDANGRPRTTVETRPVVAGVLHATTLKMVAATCQ